MANRKRTKKRRPSKWARRGQAAGDFTGSLTLGLIDCVTRGLWGMLRGSAATFSACLKHLWKGIVTMIKQHNKRIQEAKTRAAATRTSCPSQPTPPTTRFMDVVGLDEAKQEILVRSILPLRCPAVARAYKVETGGNILLWGPPGCAKTLLAQAIAGELQAGFMHVRISDMVQSGIGTAEKNVRKVFAAFRAKARAVMFFDELDGICPDRKTNRSTIMARLISEFLCQMDGIDAKNVDNRSGFSLIVAATNWIEGVDEALLRPGRFGVRIYVPIPCLLDRKAILDRALEGRLAQPGVDTAEIAAQTKGYSGADLCRVVDMAAQQVFLATVASGGQPRPLDTADLLRAQQNVPPSVSSDERLRYEEASQVFADSKIPIVPWTASSPEGTVIEELEELDGASGDPAVRKTGFPDARALALRR